MSFDVLFPELCDQCTVAVISKGQEDLEVLLARQAGYICLLRLLLKTIGKAQTSPYFSLKDHSLVN